MATASCLTLPTGSNGMEAVSGKWKAFGSLNSVRCGDDLRAKRASKLRSNQFIPTPWLVLLLFLVEHLPVNRICAGTLSARRICSNSSRDKRHCCFDPNLAETKTTSFHARGIGPVVYCGHRSIWSHLATASRARLRSKS